MPYIKKVCNTATAAVNSEIYKHFVDMSKVQHKAKSENIVNFMFGLCFGNGDNCVISIKNFHYKTQTLIDKENIL